jgi:hypothetical protein
MDPLEPHRLWLLIAGVGFFAFLLGRATKGAGPDERARRSLAEDEAIRTGLNRLSPPTLQEIDRLIAERKKIEAIRVLREATGLGLRLAKLAVERRAEGGNGRRE